jgi:hypothetical protein
MPCYSPLEGWKSRTLNKTGKRSIVFNVKYGYADLPIKVPCGQCIGCRLERSRQWAIRCHHEASQHEENCFITLTYNDKNLPENGSLDKRAFQLFMKRLRKKYEPKKIRFFHCGEYGELHQRPHYHACLFGLDFKDKKLWQITKEIPLYTSKELQELWPYGFSTIGQVTFKSAAYVARYIMKKVTGDKAEQHYQVTDPQTGEITQRTPEYTTMSRRPGIGKNWLEKYEADVYPGDFVVIAGKKMRPPKFYDRQYEIADPKTWTRIKSRRKINAKKNPEENTTERLTVRRKVKEAQAELLKRIVE